MQNKEDNFCLIKFYTLPQAIIKHNRFIKASTLQTAQILQEITLETEKAKKILDKHNVETTKETQAAIDFIKQSAKIFTDAEENTSIDKHNTNVKQTNNSAVEQNEYTKIKKIIKICEQAEKLCINLQICDKTLIRANILEPNSVNYLIIRQYIATNNKKYLITNLKNINNIIIALYSHLKQIIKSRHEVEFKIAALYANRMQDLIETLYDKENFYLSQEKALDKISVFTNLRPTQHLSYLAEAAFNIKNSKISQQNNQRTLAEIHWLYHNTTPKQTHSQYSIATINGKPTKYFKFFTYNSSKNTVDNFINNNYDQFKNYAINFIQKAKNIKQITTEDNVENIANYTINGAMQEIIECIEFLEEFNELRGGLYGVISTIKEDMAIIQCMLADATKLYNKNKIERRQNKNLITLQHKNNLINICNTIFNLNMIIADIIGNAVISAYINNNKKKQQTEILRFWGTKNIPNSNYISHYKTFKTIQNTYPNNQIKIQQQFFSSILVESITQDIQKWNKTCYALYSHNEISPSIESDIKQKSQTTQKTARKTKKKAKLNTEQSTEPPTNNKYNSKLIIACIIFPPLIIFITIYYIIKKIINTQTQIIKLTTHKPIIQTAVPIAHIHNQQTIVPATYIPIKQATAPATAIAQRPITENISTKLNSTTANNIHKTNNKIHNLK